MNRVAVVFSLLIWASPLWAGHGLLNAFAGIAWLPPAGTTPDSPWYPAERWGERVQIALAEVSARPALADSIAREKLAEAALMLKREKPAPAAIALGAWQEATQTLIATTEALPAARTQVVNALLEQQYIAMTEYLDLPRTLRPPMLAATRLVAEACSTLMAQLSRTEREALFFRAEEVRWSLEMAAAADAQGL